MNEKPILFSGPMIRAILDGRKTQTRRVMKPQIEAWGEGWQWNGHAPNSPYGFYASTYKNPVSLNIFVGSSNPYGKKGDGLWVRETFTLESNWNVDSIANYPPPFMDGRPAKTTSCPEYGEYWEQPHYRATDPEPELSYEDMEGPGCRWKPSIHMPRWASRINLEITDIRVERVQDISKADCMAEGMPELEDVHAGWHQSYAELWDSINEKRGFRWDKNPWVWVVNFKKL